jgi:ATP-dependent Lon protease
MESSSNNLVSPVIHKYNTRFKKSLQSVNYNENSDISDNDSIDSDDTEFDIHNYRQLLSNLYPSQFMDEKVKRTKSLKNFIRSKRFRKNKTLSNNNSNVIIGKSQLIEQNLSDEKYNVLNEDIENELYYEDDEDEDEDEDEYEDEDEDEDEDEYEDEDDEDEDDGSDLDDDDGSDLDDESDLDNKTNSIPTVLYSVGQSNKDTAINFNYLTQKLIKKDRAGNIIDDLVKLANDRKNKKKQIKKLSKAEENIKRQRLNNAKEFRKLLLEKDNLNDLKFFKDNMDIDNQEKLIQELKNINEVSTVDKPYRIILLESDIPQIFKISALKKISMMENMDPSVGEYFKLKNWVDTFMRIPFNKFNNLSFTMSDGLEKCNEYMEQSIATLDKAVYGLNDAKMQIMQLIGQWIVNPAAIGSAIAIKGPMGTGKTTLVKEGISKILNRPFALIALGGATDSSVLEGHGYTYEGSTWGKIVDILIQTKCSNPIIYFDELDKVSDTPRGEEIIGILTHLIDGTQNSNFHDKYFAEIDFDLSKALFIFSYNDESKVNPILLDRMYKITTKGYELKEKKIIADNYLIPVICKQIKFEENNLIFLEETLDYIVEKYTIKEAGVRNLKRCLEIIFTKLNLFRLMKPESTLFKDEKSLKVEFPFTITPEIVDKLIKKEGESNDNWKRMYM